VIYALSISGGKDSAAMWSWAKRTGLATRVAIACDTQWEADFPGVDWLGYLAELSAAIGEPVKIVSDGRGFAEGVRKHGVFPGKLARMRWCTPELKLEPFKAEVARLREEDEVTVVVGIRAEESADREKMPEREWSEFYDCEMWRPMIAWTLEQVMAEHHENGLPINPLYLLGAERVGCWPCVKAGKEELALLGRLDPKRVEQIRELEKETETTMFCLEKTTKGVREYLPTPIDGVIAWARTSRGGVQLSMVQEPSGCARWGLCEPPRRVSAKAIPETGK